MNQRQDSLTDQMRDLIPYAISQGMYDAADYINRRFPQVGQPTIIEELPPMESPPERSLRLVPKEGE